MLTAHSTYPTAHLAGTTVGRITTETPRKIDTALRVFDQYANRSQLLDRIATAHPQVRTPLRATDTLLRRDVVDLTLLGDPAVVHARATQLQLARDGLICQ